MHGYCLIKLSDVKREVGKCSACSCPLSLREDLGCRRGLVSRVLIMCSNPAYDKKQYISHSNNEDAKSLNARSVLEMCLIGLGRSGLETFCSLMDMVPPLSPLSYSTQQTVA